MLLIVSSVSVIFNLPSYTMRIKAFLIEVIWPLIFRYVVFAAAAAEANATTILIQSIFSNLIFDFFSQADERNVETTNTTIMIQTISWFLFITNFGINFVLYCLSGQNFRWDEDNFSGREIKEILFCLLIHLW